MEHSVSHEGRARHCPKQTWKCSARGHITVQKSGDDGITEAAKAFKMQRKRQTRHGEIDGSGLNYEQDGEQSSQEMKFGEIAMGTR